MTGALLTSSRALGETQVKLGAIQGVAEAVASGIKTIDVVDFPNLDNQLGTLSLQLDVNRVKSKHGAEAAYVLAGLQRAAGDAALEHAAVYIGNQQILHHCPERLSKRDTYGGFWRNYTHSIWRHKQWQLSGYTAISNNLAINSI